MDGNLDHLRLHGRRDGRERCAVSFEESRSTVADPRSVLLEPNPSDASTVSHSHVVTTSSKTSDCPTCFDSTETQTLPVATYQKGDLKKNCCASNGLVSGSTLLQSGAMATELVLADGNERVRAIFSHAPVWGKDDDPSGPPAGLKLFRLVLSQESLQGDFQTTPQPPFAWHAAWEGSSWTWGPTAHARR